MEARPYLSRYHDRHGKVRWRFRRKGKTISLPGQPGEGRFESAYRSCLAGRKPDKAELLQLPNATAPRSLKAAWRILTTRSQEWKALRPISRRNQTRIAERFFALSIAEGDLATYGDMPVDLLRRRDVKAILARFADTPHAAAHILRLIRKLIGVGFDEEWIETDPTYRLRYRPECQGWRAWTAAERIAFEKRWDIGTTPRLVYSLALYSGSRRADLVKLRWADIDGEWIRVLQQKTGRPLELPIHPELAGALEATPRLGETILVTQYGRAFSDKALGMRMQDWTRAAGLPPGCTLHGLRKTLGKLLAEGSATTRQIMDILGHTDIAHAELYTREAEQKLLAKQGMRALERRPKLVAIQGGRPDGEPGGEPNG